MFLRTRDSNQRYRLTDAACSSEDIADSSVSRSSVERPVKRSMKRAWCSTRDSWTTHVGHGLLHGVTDARCPLTQLASVSALGRTRTSNTRFREPIRTLCMTGEIAEKCLSGLGFGFWSLRVLTHRVSSSRATSARWTGSISDIGDHAPCSFANLSNVGEVCYSRRYRPIPAWSRVRPQAVVNETLVPLVTGIE